MISKTWCTPLNSWLRVPANLNRLITIWVLSVVDEEGQGRVWNLVGLRGERAEGVNIDSDDLLERASSIDQDTDSTQCLECVQPPAWIRFADGSPLEDPHYSHLSHDPYPLANCICSAADPLNLSNTLDMRLVPRAAPWRRQRALSSNENINVDLTIPICSPTKDYGAWKDMFELHLGLD